jgi:hypothetical protein
MLFARAEKSNLEEHIVELLQSGGHDGPSLLTKARKKNPKISKESFYRTLRMLLQEEVINKHAALYQLNRHWLQRIYRFSKTSIETNSGIDSDNILSFEEGDKISYSFRNPNLMGIYWAHTYDMVFEQHNKNMPILIYHPHEWLIHTRAESESFFLSRFKDDKKLAFFAINGTTELDKTFKKERANPYLQIATGITYGLKNTDYINVLGDFIFKVSVSKRFANDLEAFFRKHQTITSENQKELETLCNRKDTTKMVFTRSKKEATMWRAKYQKYFFVPRTKI